MTTGLVGIVNNLYVFVCFDKGPSAAAGLCGFPGGDERSRGTGAGWYRESPAEGVHGHSGALH